MLQIKNISKQYKTGDLVQDALKDVSLNFRDNEFVSILGPSGSGKTTLLNIVGGLDRYDSGDLIINNVSTKEYKDRDWDSYRNHTIGFVFQSYNLIPHQTILKNVELALTIGGISRKERKERALEALEQVGLKEQAHKKPTQMSGGQMQRVAIARALVNNPDILLADEPTGALDTETSVQVMNLLKEVAKDRLVIMVTHNPELAEEYSTRIVKLRDGRIVGDTDPFVIDEAVAEQPKHKNLGKASMSLFTAFALSFNNLLTKKGRTILTAFAGSIGIIGISLILALSTGFQNYIDKIQEDTLTSYPLTVQLETADTTSLLLSMVSGSGEEEQGDVVEEKQYIATMLANIGTNDLASLKTYLEDNQEKVDSMVSLVQYKYNISPLIFTRNALDEIEQLNPNTMLASMTGMSAAVSTTMSSMGSSLFTEMMDDEEAIHSQYDVLAGRWPEAYNEMILVLPEPNGMPDLMTYSLGLRDGDELEKMMAKIMSGEKLENVNEPLDWTYEELMELPFKLVDATATYRYNAEYKIYENMVDDAAYMEDVYANGIDLKIVGVVCAKDGSTSANLSPGVVYTKELTQFVLDTASESELVKKQLENKEVDVFNNRRFDDESEESGLNFEDLITVDEDMLADAFGGNISEEDIASMTQDYMTEISSAITADTSEAEKRIADPLVSMATTMLQDYIAENANPLMGGMATISMSQVDGVVDTFLAKEENQVVFGLLEADYLVPAATFTEMFGQLYKGMLQAYIPMAALDPNAEDVTAMLPEQAIEPLITQFASQETIADMVEQLATGMTEAVMQKTILTKVGELTGDLMGSVAGAFQVDPEKIAGAFQFDMNEDELTRLMTSMASNNVETTYKTNLMTLGYQDLNEPSSISFYFIDFDSKELFVDFLEDYNERMEEEDEDKVIQYTDIT